MKTLKFAENLVPLVLSGEKTRTWRFFDEKNLQIGDQITFINYTTKVPFAEAKAVSVYEKAFGSITDEDLEGHEKFASLEEMLKTYQSYYGERVNLETTVKIIDFILLEKIS